MWLMHTPPKKLELSIYCKVYPPASGIVKGGIDISPPLLKIFFLFKYSKRS